MKKLFYLFIFVYGFSFGQTKVEITKDGLTNATQIINLDGLSAKEIYSRVNKYIQKNYTNPDKVSKGNIENEFISFNGVKDYSLNEINQRLNYYITVDIKDSKIKFSFVKLIQSNPAPDKILPVGFYEMQLKGHDLLDGSNYNNLSEKDKEKIDKFNEKHKESIKKDREITENVINSILTDFISSIKEQKNDNW